MQEPAEPRAPTTHRLARERIIGKTCKELGQCDARFEPGEIQSRTSVDPECKCEVAVRLPREIEPVRILELRRITVRRADADVDSRVGWHADPAHDDFLGRDAVSELDRALEAQELFDRAVRDLL